MSDFIPEDLFVGEPVIAVRWRLQNNALPLKNRHLRAFGHLGTTMALQSWARQHLEWTLAEGSLGNADGVLTVAVDDQGRAMMAVEAYEPLARADAEALLGRAALCAAQPVAAEVAWLARDGALVALVEAQNPPSGANSLVADLAQTLGTPVAHDPALLFRLVDGTEALGGDDELFLVSDEHGVVPASDRPSQTADRFAAYYRKLAQVTRADPYDRANLGLGA